MLQHGYENVALIERKDPALGIDLKSKDENRLLKKNRMETTIHKIIEQREHQINTEDAKERILITYSK